MDRKNKWCPACERTLDKSCYFKNRARYDGISTLCKDCHHTVTSGSQAKTRATIIEKYGSKCARCPENDAIVLQIDHVNGGGHAHRASLKNWDRYYKEVLADESGKFQLLCANCNIRKRHTDKEMFRRKRITDVPKTERPPIVNANVASSQENSAAWAARNAKIRATKAATKAGNPQAWEARFRTITTKRIETMKAKVAADPSAYASSKAKRRMSLRATNAKKKASTQQPLFPTS